MTDAADPSVFEDTDRHEININEDDLLGTHVFDDVLYTGDAGVVNILNGETPDELDKSVGEAKAFARRVGQSQEAPRVARKQPPEAAVESRSPYVASAFFHYSITGGMDWHTVFRRAFRSDAYDVDHSADYESGSLTITISRSQ